MVGPRQEQPRSRRQSRNCPGATEVPGHIQPAGQRLSRSHHATLAGILLLGLILRVSYIREIRRAPDFEYPALDAAFHDFWARCVISGDWAPPKYFSDPKIYDTPFFRPPGYPYFLAGVYAITGGSYLGARIVQSALGLVNCLLAYFLGKSLFGPGAGLIVAALMSCYWIFIYFEGELLAPVLLVFLTLSLLLVLRRWAKRATRTSSLAAGLVFGFYALALPNVLLFGPFILAWCWWVARRRAEPRRLWSALACFPLAAAVAIAPATIRNWMVAKDVVLITSNAGVNLYIGNNERTDCVTADIPILGELTGLTGWTCFDQPAIVSGVERITGRRMSDSQVSSYFSDKAVDFIRRHPLDAVRLAWKKTLLFWGPVEISNNKSLHHERKHSATLRHLPDFPLAVSLALVGGLLIVRDRRAGRPPGGAGVHNELLVLIAAFIVVYFASFVPFFVAGRYRVPLIPLLLLFAAYALLQGARMIHGRRWRAVLVYTAVWGVLYQVAGRPLVAHEPDPGLWHFGRGDAYRKQGRTELAVAEFRSAIEVGQWPDPRAYNNLGAGLLELRQETEAIESFREAVRIKPDYLEARQNLASALIRQGKIEEARPHLAAITELAPENLEAWYNLGTILLREGRFELAVSHLSEAVRLDPQYVHAHQNLAQALERTGRTDEAIEHYESALRLRPDLAGARYAVATLLAGHGQKTRAVEHLEWLLREHPDDEAARRLLANLRSSATDLRKNDVP